MSGPAREAQRLERFEQALARLREEAMDSLVVVEGSKDLAALKELGVGGAQVALNLGLGLEDFIDQVARRALDRRRKVILLTDWDRTGGRLYQRLHEALVGRVPVDGENRRRLAVASQVQCVEDLPRDLYALQRIVHPDR